jgi:hypothetical protein
MIRLLLVPFVLALGLVWLGPGVAGACACGAVITDQRLVDVQETALVELGDGREAVTLNIGGHTDAEKAAFIMPVPARAAFELADSAVFAELDTLSAPRIEYEEVVVDDEDGSGAAAPQDPGVTVTDHVDVGPFEVAQLTGADSRTVADWLGRNDFVLSDKLAAALDPYLAEGWLVVAARLTPDGADTLADGLPSMRITFAAEDPVYPMRLSATADHGQPLRLYVLADHRMDVSNPAPRHAPAELTFAGRVEAGKLAEYPVFAGMVDKRRFLTRYDATFSPSAITGDITFTRAKTDDSFRAVVVKRRYVSGTPEVVWVVGGVVVAGATMIGLLRFRGRRQ